MEIEKFYLYSKVVFEMIYLVSIYVKGENSEQ